MRSHASMHASTPPALHDKWLVSSLIAIIALGLLMMTSASIEISERQMHQPFYYLTKQLVFLLMGVFAGSFVLQIDTSHWEKHRGILLLSIMFALALVLIPGVGHRVNGSARWLGIGPLSFQISELTKLTFIIYMAGYLVKQNHEIQSRLSGFIKPMLMLSVVAMLLMREPDFGATVVVVSTTLGMMFLAGMRLRHFVVLFTTVGLMMAALAVSAPYRLARLSGFLNPWAHPFDTGYQLTQSLIAFGRGGLMGVGLGKSIQKMFYLPEAHTDFLFAVIGEELGFLGMLLIIGLFLMLVVRIFIIGKHAQELKRHFAGFMAYGFGCWFSIQFIVSIGVNTGLLPTKGLTLPLMSYGGSSVLVSCVVAALLIRIDHENRLAALRLR